ncbi:uncharacterized protein B0I36DRAFT_338836 [Microdochium trichocladiopsis]|uniref:Zn(2)-C6 fungal-type domain-containing protein n=1 Tax=Microdochium trichocladiopsis TaxID=1682393 RepID=A0A9P8XSB6_9PEZI|nr:uncharacterized protein B0I36DRAFT_338836 [Microdochium trichocladiopsis]KAH7014514.1 hypothetical protein B0I36DRAFT_338836 [Microdochium trichocladiopsis]
MPSRFDKQKACVPCADAKRRCDKALPECQRCLDRDVDCRYPQPKRRRRDLPAAAQPVPTAAVNATAVGASGQPVSVPASAELVGLDPSAVLLNDWALSSQSQHLSSTSPPDPLSTTDMISLDTPDSGFPSSASPSSLATTLPWFLQPHSWTTHHSNHDPGCVSDIELEPSIEHIKHMLQGWLTHGHSPFIHRKLYSTGPLPDCLQDAYATLSAYTHRTSETRDLVVQIAESKMAALLARETGQDNPALNGNGSGQSSSSSSTAKDVIRHLSRVQALFVHLFIHLFDGSVRQRSKAEKHLPLLREWVLDMYTFAQRYNGDDLLNPVPESTIPTSTNGELDLSLLPRQQGPPHRPPRVIWHFNSSTLAAELDDDARAELWRAWIITESVRRTYTVVDTVVNVYQIMTQGWSECQGGLSFTGRRGAWEAENAVRWAEVITGKGKSSGNEVPLLVPALRPEEVMAQCSAGDVDDFSIMCWTFIVGRDKLQSWVDRSGGR